VREPVRGWYDLGMTEREHEDQSHEPDDNSSPPPSGLIPDADAGETSADSVSRDEDSKGHEEYQNP
jgi:hypothetical protein